MSKISDLDIQQIFRELVNPEDMSLRVDPQLSGEVNIELNAEDGDSVQVRPMCGQVLSLASQEALDVSKARTLFISSTQPITSIEVSLDSETWHPLNASGSHLSLDSVPFKQIRVTSTGDIKYLIKG